MFQVRLALPGSAHRSGGLHSWRLSNVGEHQRLVVVPSPLCASKRSGMGGDVAEQVMSMCSSRLVLAESSARCARILVPVQRSSTRRSGLGACGPEAPVSRLPRGGLVAGYSSWKAPEQ